MARDISADGTTPVYRAVTEFYTTNPDKPSWTRHEGPYASVGAAKARVTFWKNYMTGKGYVVVGWVEEGTVDWKRV